MDADEGILMRIIRKDILIKELSSRPERHQIEIMRKALERDWSAYSEHDLRELVDDASRALGRCMEGRK